MHGIGVDVPIHTATIQGGTVHRRRAPLAGQIRNLRLVLLATVLVAAAIVRLDGLAAATEDQRCTITQVTDTVDDAAGPANSITPEAVAGDGSLVTFSSNADLTGENPDLNDEVFVHRSSTGEISQVTSTLLGYSLTPVISADGSTVAFSSSHDLTEENPDRSDEIFTYDTTTETITQVTSNTSTDIDALLPSLSSDGERVLYLADGIGFVALNLLDTSTGVTTELLPDVGAIAGGDPNTPALSPDGSRATFVSNGNLTGDNPDLNGEVFLYDVDTATLTQVTSTGTASDGGGSNFTAGFTDNGQTVVFESDGAIVGPNPGFSFGTYLFNITTGMTSHLTSRAPNVSNGVISVDGTQIVFGSDANLTGGNPDGNSELFAYDVESQSASQLTDTVSSIHGTARLTLSSDGGNIVWLTDRDIDDNPDHNLEIYLVTTCDPAPRPDAKIASARSGPYTGRHLYAVNSTREQKLKRPIWPAAIRKFFVRIQNERDATDTFTLSGGDTGAPGYQVTYLAGRDDITDQIQDGTYVVGPLDPGESVTVKVKIRAVTAGPGTSHVADLTARSHTNPVAADTVRAKVTRTR